MMVIPNRTDSNHIPNQNHANHTIITIIDIYIYIMIDMMMMMMMIIIIIIIIIINITGRLHATRKPRPVSTYINIKVLNALPDPGALSSSSCRHTFPEKSDGLTTIQRR